jgi:hypothetical protein
MDVYSSVSAGVIVLALGVAVILPKPKPPEIEQKVETPPLPKNEQQIVNEPKSDAKRAEELEYILKHLKEQTARIDAKLAAKVEGQP